MSANDIWNPRIATIAGIAPTCILTFSAVRGWFSAFFVFRGVCDHVHCWNQHGLTLDAAMKAAFDLQRQRAERLAYAYHSAAVDRSTGVNCDTVRPYGTTGHHTARIHPHAHTTPPPPTDRQMDRHGLAHVARKHTHTHTHPRTHTHTHTHTHLLD